MMMMVPMMMPNGMMQMQQVPMSTGNQVQPNNLGSQNNMQQPATRPQAQGQPQRNNGMAMFNDSGNGNQTAMALPMQQQMSMQPMQQQIQNYDPSGNNTRQSTNDTNSGGNEASIPMPSLNMWGDTSSLVTPNAPVQHNHQNGMQMGSSYQMTGNQGGQQELLAGFHNGGVPASSTNPTNNRGSGRGGRANSAGENGADGSTGQSYSSNLAHCA
jgi:hypothetical protein